MECIVDAPSEMDGLHRTCTSSDDCKSTPNTTVCDTKLTQPLCVQCTDEDHGQCTGTTPLCTRNHCAACVANDDCGTSGLCLPSGACVAAASIIHAVSTGGLTASGCGSPVSPCTLEHALAEVTATKNVIKLDDNGSYKPTMDSFVVDDKDTNITEVIIDARGFTPGGATLQPIQNDKPLLSVNDGKTVTIFGGTISGVLGNDGILCGSSATLTVDGTTIQVMGKSAINISTNCKLTVTNATITQTSLNSAPLVASILADGASITLSRSSLYSNKGGGIHVTNGTFVIVRNSFSNNGDVQSPSGGVSITTTTSDPINRIEFNTIAFNQVSSGGKAPGIHCAVGSGLTARNNIIWNNTGSTMEVQVSGTCQHAYSDIGPTSIVATNDGGNNWDIDPKFVIPDLDLHLQPTSPMIMKADPNAKLDGIAATDIDDDPRIAPADIGFDQRPR